MEIIDAKEDKWSKAQEAERAWWLRSFKNLKSTSDDYFKKYTTARINEIMKYHKEPPKNVEGKFILEVGSGPLPFIIYFNKAKYRLAVDPLFNFYAEHTHLKAEQKNLGVFFHCCKIEEFKFWRDRKFDIIICSNVLDHCDDPKKVMDNILAHLDKDGAIYLDVFLRNIQDSKDVNHDCHPHAWPTVEAFGNWFTDNYLHFIQFNYVRVLTSKPWYRIFVKITFK